VTPGESGGRSALRWSILLCAGTLASPASSQEPPSEGDATPKASTPRLRGGAHAGLGGATASPVYSGGVGLGAELGCQFNRWLALSVTGYAESAFLMGRGHAGALLQVAPVEELEIGVGGGVGGMYVANFVHASETASYGSFLLRPTLRLPQAGELFETRPGSWHLVLGGEGELGLSYAGTVRDVRENASPLSPGTLVVGGRVFVGFLL
jgi:hypothetical protein